MNLPKEVQELLEERQAAEFYHDSLIKSHKKRMQEIADQLRPYKNIIADQRPKAQYRFEATVKVSKPDSYDRRKRAVNDEILTFTGTLANNEAIQEWRKQYEAVGGCPYNLPDERIHSVTYYRTDQGILTHSNGGHVMLKTPVLCDDDMWERLKRCEFGDLLSDWYEAFEAEGH